MYNESRYFKFELYAIHVGSINSFGGSKVPTYWQPFLSKLCYYYNFVFLTYIVTRAPVAIQIYRAEVVSARTQLLRSQTEARGPARLRATRIESVS